MARVRLHAVDISSKTSTKLKDLAHVVLSIMRAVYKTYTEKLMNH